MRICRRCGVHAPPDLPSCEQCGADLSSQAREVALGSLMFAAVELEFRCPSCARLSPIDFLPGDGLVRCVPCEADHPLEPRHLHKVLELAHAVADLMAAHPEGRKVYTIAIDEVNPFASPGRSRSGIRVSTEDKTVFNSWLPSNLRMWVAPGHPLDPQEGEPVDVRLETPGTLSVRSSMDEVRYAIPTEVMSLHAGLVGAVADEHRKARGAPDVILVEGQDGPQVCCPSCDAPLHTDGGLKLLRCSQCNCVVHLPARIRHLLQPEPRPDLWWLAFEGRSPYRRFLERDPRTRGQTGDRHLDKVEQRPRTTPESLTRWTWSFVLPTTLLLAVGLLSRLPAMVRWILGL